MSDRAGARASRARNASGNGRASSRAQGFGFRPDESEHHFVVTVPGGARKDVLIAEHLSFEPDRRPASLPGMGAQDARYRVMLARPKWDAIADPTRVEFNRRLKHQGLPPGRWKRGNNLVTRLLGKELTLLAWAVEDADPALIPAALRNWQGLAPEERWWLFTMTSAATGHALHGRNKGWRKAVRFALTENPVSGGGRERPAEIFRLVPPEAREDEGRSRPGCPAAAGTKAIGAGAGEA